MIFVSTFLGFGIMGTKGKLDEYRVQDLYHYTDNFFYCYCMQGQSWSIGMDEGVQTVANFLKFYNPSLIGGSIGHHVVEVSLTTTPPSLVTSSPGLLIFLT